VEVFAFSLFTGKEEVRHKADDFLHSNSYSTAAGGAPGLITIEGGIEV
jgi:hypothetical protein